MYKVKKFVDSGSRSYFYNLHGSRRKGFKTFLDREDAEYAHRIQSELAENDFAPRVYSEVGKIRGFDGQLTRWGYITEIAETLSCGDNCSCDDCMERETDIESDIEDLRSSIEDFTGYDFYDAHIGNVGYVKRHGKKVLVCIDTGRESVGNGSSECNCSQCQYERGEQYV